MGEWEDLHRPRAESKALRHGKQGRGQGPSWDTLERCAEGTGLHTKSVREPDGSVQAGNNMTLLAIQTNHSFLCGELEILGMRGLGWGQ